MPKPRNLFRALMAEPEQDELATLGTLLICDLCLDLQGGIQSAAIVPESLLRALTTFNGGLAPECAICMRRVAPAPTPEV